MRKLFAPLTVFICMLLAPVALFGQYEIDGHWEGSAKAPIQDIELRLDLSKTDDGTLKAIMSIPESRLVAFPVPKVTFTESKLRLEVPSGWGLAMFRDLGFPQEQETILFDGELRNDRIIGNFRLSSFSAPITLERGYRPLPYRQEDVRFQNGDVSLAGTLFLPPTKGPHPVVVFTHGSGDRTREGHRLEADFLARRGIGSLRYDKRGAGDSTGANWQVATFEELASDAEAGIRFLLSRNDVNHKQIGLYGLSQGTWLIAIVALRSKDVAFLISVSGSGVAVWEQDLFRTESMMRLRQFSEDDIRAALAFNKRAFAVARTGVGWPSLDAEMKALKEKKERWFADYATEYRSLTSARFWWIAAFSHDPAMNLSKVKVPVLTLLGEKDLSFNVRQVAERMEQSLKKAGNQDYVIKFFPLAEHQMMTPQEANGQPFRRVVTPDYEKTMVDWLLKRVHVSH